ncbi:hypothetical protein Syun_003764 [Stephania yunnanensis]|uniref:Uncharacterized protein n=1 Tax=Stephania yunnanensis TaxID=152371 RepID=A0AAP0Q046_9MAGN
MTSTHHSKGTNRTPISPHPLRTYSRRLIGASPPHPVFRLPPPSPSTTGHSPATSLREPSVMLTSSAPISTRLHTRGDRVQEGQWGARLTASNLTALYFILFIHETHNMFPVRHDATALQEDYLLLYAISLGIAVNYGHMLFKAICLRAHNRKYWKKLSFPCLITALLATKEVFTIPLDVIVEAHVRTIRSIILKASSPYLADLPVSTALLEPVKYPAEALIFLPKPYLTPPTGPLATVGTPNHSSHVPLLLTDD